MVRLLLALTIVTALSSTALADDFYEGYVCEVRLSPLDVYTPTADKAGFGRMNFSVRPNADCTGTFQVLWVCSVDVNSGTDCAGGNQFTRPEMQAIYAALTNAVASGLRAAAYTSTGRTAIQVLHIKR